MLFKNIPQFFHTFMIADIKGINIINVRKRVELFC